MKFIKYSFFLAVIGLSLSMTAQQSINSAGGDSGTGHLSHSIGQITYTTISSVSDDASMLQGVHIPYETYGNEPDCSVFDTSPVDLTKSFDPVNGVQDRVQLKWYKASPQVRYSDEDAAMCDIKFWKKRDLIPGTTTPTGPAYVNPDTLLISNAKKTYGDGSPREIFKWPVKYVADGANNNKRAEPNLRYQWQVRCECGHDGTGPESPWSAIKIFNTPDFDTVTGIYTPSSAQAGVESFKADHLDTRELKLFPNPSRGVSLGLQISYVDGVRDYMVIVRDLQGRLIESGRLSQLKAQDYHLWTFSQQLDSGMYSIELVADDISLSERFIVE